MNYGYDPRKIKTSNSRDLNHLHPIVKYKAELFIKKADADTRLRDEGWSIKIISTLRTFEEQDDLYAQGRTKPGKKVTNARGGYSTHNWGCAIDIGVFKDGKYNPVGCEAIYEAISMVGKSIGFTWGGDFKSIRDMPHYEYTGTYSSSEFCRLAREGKPIDEMVNWFIPLQK